MPCFIRWPVGGLEGGRDIHHLVAHFDLLPTLIELCQLKRPAQTELDGVSLAGLLTGRDATWRKRTLFVHHQELPLPKKHRFGCVMQDSWRLITRTDQSDLPRFELFDLPRTQARNATSAADIPMSLHGSLRPMTNGGTNLPRR